MANSKSTFSDSPSTYTLLHYMSMVLSILGVLFLLSGRGHYTIDVLMMMIMMMCC